MARRACKGSIPRQNSASEQDHSEKNTAALATSSKRTFSLPRLLLQQLNLDITLCLNSLRFQRAFHRATVPIGAYSTGTCGLVLSFPHEAGASILKAVCPKDRIGKSEHSSLTLVPLADNLNHAQDPGTLWTFDSRSVLPSRQRGRLKAWIPSSIAMVQRKTRVFC